MANFAFNRSLLRTAARVSEMGRLQLRSSALEPLTRGDGIEKRLLHAAEAGDAHAQCNLGIIYANGLDDNGHAIAASQPQAARWLLAAAEQGLPRAQVKLAALYAEAPDTADRYANACGWFLVSAAGLRGIHQHHARSRYERLAAKLTPVQIAGAKSFAQNWKPKLPRQARRPVTEADAGDTP
jgi:TPR repeat protein